MEKLTRVMALVLLSITLATDCTRGDEAAIALIRDANKHSMESIQALYAKYKVVTRSLLGKGGSTETECEWWQDGSKARWTFTRELIINSPAGTKASETQVTKGTICDDGVLIGDEIRIQSRQRVGKQDWITGGVIKTFKRDDYFGQDVWIEALMVIQIKPRASLSNLLLKGSKVEILAPELANGHLCTRLLLTPTKNNASGMRYEVLVDSRYNQMVRKLTLIVGQPAMSGRSERTVLKVQECDQGIFFPTSVEGRKLRVTPGGKEEVSSITTTTFEKVVVNRPIPAERFKFEFTPGTDIVNQKDQTQYKIGKDQKPDGPVQSTVLGQPIRAEPSYVEQPSFLHRYYLTLVAVVSGFAIVGAWWYFRHKRAAS